MIRVNGLEKVRPLLTRQAVFEAPSLPPRVAEKVREVFGAPLTAEQVVQRIIDDVRKRGDEALLHYARVLDGVELKSLRVSREEIAEAWKQVPAPVVEALKLAAERVRAFHQQCKERGLVSFREKGLGVQVRPLDRVGLYVPGGTAVYPSSVLMTAIPAEVAGVPEIIIASPAGPGGVMPAATLVAADIAGVHVIIKAGGAQAVAALAYGTTSVPKVDKICGPGNLFVMLAKKMVFGAVAIDGLQGPSEVMVVADAYANPAFCAADILAQAEHDPLAATVLVTDSAEMAEKVSAEINGQLATLDRQVIAGQALRNTILAVVANLEEAVSMVNLYAPEHLSLQVREAEKWASRVRHAGCICIGGGEPVALGDYTAGPSHVLPTGGSGHFSSPLGIPDFLKVNNIIGPGAASSRAVTEAAITLAKAEGLTAHARALEMRLEENSR
jgi:histidinol dehydrogenase